ncbi:MAG: GNAT family N-acetyltransferase [Clostridium argentinense]|uniref:GNAT family N-acetyltransferase n=1 Tax=Clostridium faecium TaxID=2762223 RepID=A0ABR8YUE4_9CLOT|nr:MULTISPECIES: GNAT family protein [Clostridium]MBD8047757.1 GNAT family N-acetyltransferase [Clostridium faecium]MBS5824153.1 GNAT family N-acetyltransferase [Clostridium argentinense]
MENNTVKLRQDVFTSDAWKIIDWLEDDEIIRYLNEKQNVGNSIRETIYRVNMPILTPLFNQYGSFFMITTDEKEPIGFLRLVPKGKVAEMVIVIGEKDEWGKGLGANAIKEGLKQAFFDWRVEEVIAKINFANERSKRVFSKVGFIKDKELAKEIQYAISMEKFLKLAA